MDQKDMFSFFIHLRKLYSEEEIYSMLENYEVSKLDINRMYRYLDKYTQKVFESSDDNGVGATAYDSDDPDIL